MTGVPAREDGAVRAIVLYSPFNSADRDFIDMAWEQDRTIAEYVGELDGNWLIVMNGRELQRDEWATTTALADDTFVMAQVPQGGKGGGILKIVLMIAVVALAAYAGPALAGAIGGLSAAMTTTVGTIISAAIIGAGSFLINSVLPDAKPATQEAQDSSRSYGLDGAKSTSQEEIPVPIVYGEFRVAGNRVNVHVENSADGLSQTFYAQYAVSEGPIESIDMVELNSQPIGAFQDVEIQTRMGTVPQSPVSWFDQTITPHFDGRAITQGGISYNTQSPVDKVRLDLVFPQGLATIDPKSGNRSNRSVTLTATARNLATNTVYPISGVQWSSATRNGSNQTSVAGTQMRVTVRVLHNAVTTTTEGPDGPVYTGDPESGNYNFEVVLRAQDATELLRKTEAGHVPPPVYQYEDLADNAQGRWGTLVQNGQDFTYEVSGNGTPYFYVELANNSGAYASVEIVSIEVLGPSPNIIITRAERAAVRVSIASPALPRGNYQIYISRSNAPSTSDYVLDAVTLSDVNEILTDQVGYVRTASYAVRVKLTDQLNSEPSVTARVRGRKVYIYDKNGGRGEKIWSANPADIVLDMLLSDDWERKFSASRIDFPAFVRWRIACAAQNLTFNGVFDSNGNVWDSLMAVCRVGRANMVVVGTKWSVILEAPSEPVMVFGDNNIISGSFSNEWFGREGRANRVEVQYYDREDRNKRKSVFATDEVALARGDAIRDASINLIGVDNAAQAQKEAELQLRINQRLVQGCRFRAYIDALGCLPGDVVLVQHTMPAWGWSSRVKSVASGVVALESPLNPPGGLFEKGPDPQDFLAAGDWRIMISRPAVQRATATVTAASGSLLTVTGVHNEANDPNLPFVRRVIVNGQDFRVLDATFLASETVYALDRPTGATPGMSAALWSTEMLQQGVIERPREWATEVTTVGWGGHPIQAGDQVLIGRTTSLGKKFRVKKFAYSNDQERELELVEYDPWVYEPGSYTPGGNASELQTSALQVTGLAADAYARVSDDRGSALYYARATWIAPLNDQWGHAGSKVYVSRNFSDFVLYETVPTGRYESIVQADVGETVRFKVVAYSENGRISPFVSAPIASVLVRPNLAPPDPPINFIGVAGPNQVTLYWDPPVAGIMPAYYVVYANEDDGALSGAVPIGQTGSPFFVVAGIPGGAQRWFWVRSFSSMSVSSGPVGPVNATATFAALAENQFPIERVAELPVGLDLNDAGRVYFLTAQDGVYLPGRLYRWNGTGWVSEINGIGDIPEGGITSDKIQNIAAEKIDGQLASNNFSQSLRPIERVSSMPTTGNFQGRVVYLTANDVTSFPPKTFVANKLYRWTGSTWTAEVSAVDIDSRGLDIRDDFGNVVFGHDGAIDDSAYVNLNGNNVLISTIAANSLTPALNFVGEFSSPPTQGSLGDNWKQNSIYKNTTDGKSYVLTGTPLGWVVYVADGQSFSVVVESTNGTVFRVGQAQSTMLIGRLFKNGAEVTSSTPDSWFRWRRISAIPQSTPNDDATWNALYSTGYKQISISVDSVYARATFFCDIISP